MVTVREIIVVEGRYDAAAVKRAVQATVVETAGFGIFSEPIRWREELLRSRCGGIRMNLRQRRQGVICREWCVSGSGVMNDGW